MQLGCSQRLLSYTTITISMDRVLMIKIQPHKTSLEVSESLSVGRPGEQVEADPPDYIPIHSTYSDTILRPYHSAVWSTIRANPSLTSFHPVCGTLRQRDKSTTTWRFHSLANCIQPGLILHPSPIHTPSYTYLHCPSQRGVFRQPTLRVHSCRPRYPTTKVFKHPPCRRPRGYE